MDPIQYFLVMKETHNISCVEAREETCRKFVLDYAEFEQALLDARSAAQALLFETRDAAEAFGV